MNIASTPAAPAPASEVNLAASRDTGVLSAVIRALQLERQQPMSGIPIIVDPRPLLDGGGFPAIIPETFARVPSEILESRATALRRLGVQPGDAAAPQQNCAGATLPAPLPGQPDLKQGCPPNDLIAIAVSLPRAGTAKVPPGQPYDYVNLQAAEGYWTVRVARSLVGPGGNSLQYYDVIMRKDGTKWLYVTRVPLLISE